MCSIIASYSRDKFQELIDLNQFRGNFSYSYTEFENNRIQEQIKNFGEFNLGDLGYNYSYKIGHVQAPTGGMIKDTNRIHPVNTENIMLWHNGLLTPRGIKFLQNKLGVDETFDTFLLTLAIEKFDFEILNEIEGLFSCLMIKSGKIYVFRTKHGKLYIDNDMNISSERFENSKCIDADTVYELDIIKLKYNIISKFKTKRFNFAIEGEL